MVNTQLKILRVFGPTAAEVSAVLRQARAEGCPGLRLLERDGEFAVCVQVSAPNRAMAEQYCDKWVQKLRAKFGDDVFAEGETSLAQATLDLLLEKRKLIVAVDETTGRLLGNLLQPLSHSEAAFDFGTESYADAQRKSQIAVPPQLLKKFPGDVVQAAAGRAVSAMQVTGADYALAYMPATVGQCPFVLVCDRHGAAACALPPELSDAAIGNQMLDLLRRRVQGLRLTDSCIIFRPGRDRPMLIVSEAGRERGNTVRFSLRRRTPPVSQTGPVADFEPMMDFDTAEPAMPQPTRPVQERTFRDDSPTGTILFETDLEEEPAAATVPRTQTPPPAEADPLAIETAGPAMAQASRHRRLVTPPPQEKAPTPSILDGEVPDFSAEIDPQVLAAAQAADDADEAAGRVTSAKEFSRAATRLFSDEEEEEIAAAQPPARTRARKTRDAAPEEPGNAAALRDRSLAIIEKTERRRRRTVILLLVVLVLALLAGAGALWWFLHTNLGARPVPRNYGTALYDETAEEYLANALEKRPGVVGYLGWPGLDGTFVYSADAETRQDADEEGALLRFATPNALDGDVPGNTVLSCSGNAYAAFTSEETIKENSGFTLFLQDRTYRFKIVSVYYYDPAEEGEGAFDLYGSTDLSSYYDYLSFVAGIQARSLWDTGVDVGDRSRFLTLTGASGEEGVQLCITGRLVEEDETAALDGAAIMAAEEPLLTALQYQRKNQPMPAVGSLLSASVDRYAQQSAASVANRNNAQDTGTEESTDLSDEIAAMQQQTDALVTSTNKLLEGLTDVAGSGNESESNLNQGAEGTLPEQTVTVDQVTATPAPTETPAPDGASSDSESGDNSGSSGGGSVSGETINVTMNGTAQTMDLVQCLAMVAQNELGSNAPLEAYKAQCVATHCWILSQSGYPSVAGTTPGATALAAAQEVARVLTTYNGQVCFTPYFASASTGTASAAEVWGNDRPWLQAVDSPYDQQVATNWHTNGNESGTARFSRQTLLERIKSELSIDLTNVDPNQWFKILSANQYGWVAKIQVGPDGNCETVSGRWFRENLLARQSVDGRSLRSQCFTVSYDSGSDCFIFDVYGYGHGCGMSQWGAIGYARNGWGYQDILLHYYPGTTITTY
ncbi:MAG TPA: SpoIID/LytB domain-containing protein [Candidatus Gemmiger excrementavium]|uniref:SpoIID/LytB domain-containing protein n=1 Tax=Candidatus Gemmiger excrementavium TaxID=2838608 RepID=A0A9D2F2P9_9FIRM|nr:SpoIID/LytB domain-containing protein [Candidatus Gemmiger excrementavium]